jgi:hypothetical protein
MHKILIDIMIVGGVIFAYIFMAAFQPGTNAIINSVNSSTNWTGFESTQAAINSYPLWGWLIPGLVGIIAFVVNHKGK